MATSTIKKNMRTKTFSKDLTIGGGERISQVFSDSTVNKIVAATLVDSPNRDWVICRPYILSDKVVCIYMHNEYTGALSGTLSVLIIYE